MLEIGSLVDGKYKILRVVGKGGMSVVYQAVNEKANKIWAIKEVRKDGVQNFEVVKQNLIVETELLKRFNHPNLPSIIDVIDGDGSFLIVMDYIEGNSLSSALEESGAQSQEDVIEWSKQLCDVLGYLHSRKPPIIYRDMKPANVMLKPDGNVSLIDFGTAREFKSSSVEDTTCLGTQGYAAPEQYGGHGQTDARTDIYCLGATMYHLVTGHNPSTPPYEMYPIRQWNPMLSSGLEEIIIKCTQRNPEDRYQSCAELLYALDHYQDLDIENKKVQSLKWKTFIASIILTIVMLFTTIGFSIASNAMSASTYDNLILEGDNAAEDSKAEAAYEKAIKDIDPGDSTAYIKLLELYTKDNQLSREEFEKLQDLETSNENLLISRDKKSFIDNYMMNLANFVFFGYGGSKDDGWTYAAKLYKKVVKNTDDAQIKTRAQLLDDLASSYISRKNKDIAGDNSVDKTKFWNSLTKLADGKLIENQNSNIALQCYAFVVSDIDENGTEFTKIGVTDKEITDLLESVRTTVNEIKSSSNLESSLKEKAQGIIDTIDEIEKLGNQNKEVKGAE